MNTNPISPTRTDDDDVRTWGHAQSVGIEGEKDAVKALYDDLLEDSRRYYDANPTEREWL